MAKQEMTSGQNDMISDDIVKVKETIAVDDSLKPADRDYKKDMFKYKENFKASEQKAIDLEERIKDFELQDHQRKGNYQKVIEDLKDELRNTKGQLATRDFTFANTTIDSALKQEALKHGCVDPELLVKLIGKEKKDRIAIDDGFNPDNEDVKGLIESAMKDFDHIKLFGKSTRIVDGTPNSRPISQPDKTVSQMSKGEIENLLLNGY